MLLGHDGWISSRIIVYKKEIRLVGRLHAMKHLPLRLFLATAVAPERQGRALCSTALVKGVHMP